LLLLDTDHYSEWERAFNPGLRLRARLEASRPAIAHTIITIEEQMRGWLAQINRQASVQLQIQPCAKLLQQVDNFAQWTILPFDADAARLFVEFRRQGVRIGSLDLKIACIALARKVTLLTRNTVDFSQVPGLPFENWLD